MVEEQVQHQDHRDRHAEQPKQTTFTHRAFSVGSKAQRSGDVPVPPVGRRRRCCYVRPMNKPARVFAESLPDTAFTAHEYAAMLAAGAFVDLRVELVRGELRKMMPSGFSHGEMNGLLYGELRVAFAATDRRLAIDLAIEIDSRTVRGGDVAVVLPDVPRDGPVPARHVVMIAEIAATTLGVDLGDKLADYARAGIPDYWVADLDAAVMHIMRAPEGDRYRERSVVPFGTPMAVPGTDRSIMIG